MKKYVYSPVVREELDFLNEIIPNHNFIPISECEDTTPIKDLDMSIRLKNLLSSAKVSTFGDLKNLKPTQLWGLRNFGPRSLKELNEYFNILENNQCHEKTKQSIG